MDKNYCKCCKYFRLSRGSQSLEESIECTKHNTVGAVTTENLHDTCDDFTPKVEKSLLSDIAMLGGLAMFMTDGGYNKE